MALGGTRCVNTSKCDQQPDTFVDRWEAFSQPVAAASELDPQTTVCRDDGFWKRVSTETAFKKKESKSPSKLRLLTPVKVDYIFSLENLQMYLSATMD